jgi:hypothetical protein
MDLVIGGGTYGARAIRYLLARGRRFVVVDPDPACLAAAEARDSGARFIVIPGGLGTAFRAFLDHEPELVFPTAPVHVAAGMVCKAQGFLESAEDIRSIVRDIPPALVLDTRGGSLYLSLNRDTPCVPDCPAPGTCPVTGEDRTIPLHDRLRRFLPGAFVLESVQVAPGLGALRGRDVADLIDRVRGRQRVCIGTACRCHGVVTALVPGNSPGLSWGARHETGD